MPFQPTYDVPPERRAYQLEGGEVGCLILHGFMGSPKSTRPLSVYLSRHNLTIRCPLLPGHGHYPDKLHNVSHRAWLAEAEEAYDELRQRCGPIFIIGHSMGAVLGAHLTTCRDGIGGLIMLAPPWEVPDPRLRWMRYLRFVMPWLNPLRSRRLRPLVRERVLDFDPTLDYDSPEVQAGLPALTRLPTSGLDEMRKMTDLGQRLWPRVQTPVLIIQGGHDVAVTPGNAEEVHQRIPHTDKTLRHFPRAGHELMRPFDADHETVWSLIEAFIADRVAPLQQVRDEAR